MKVIRTCSIVDCPDPPFGKGWCSKHYKRWKRNGDPLLVRRIIGDDEARFWSYVDKDGPTPETRPDLGPCWLWTGSTQSRGYGQVNIGGQIWLAHRFSWTLAGNDLVESMQLDHLCRIIICVRPLHLEQVTGDVNLMRSDSPPAVNARKTHCIRGHEFTPENTYMNGASRICRTCQRP